MEGHSMTSQVLSLLCWFCTVGPELMKLDSAEQSSFIFRPISVVLCGRPILLTRQPCGNWFGVSCRDLQSWPRCRLRQAGRLKAFLKFIAGWRNLGPRSPRCWGGDDWRKVSVDKLRFKGTAKKQKSWPLLWVCTHFLHLGSADNV